MKEVRSAVLRCFILDAISGLRLVTVSRKYEVVSLNKITLITYSAEDITALISDPIQAVVAGKSEDQNNNKILIYITLLFIFFTFINNKVVINPHCRDKNKS